MYCNKKITLTLFVCLLLTIVGIAVGFVVRWLWDKIIGKNEYFYTKRNTRLKLYKSDEIFDPDETPEYDEYDPDDEPLLFDPDQQPLLNPEKLKNK
jgi:hypothetical protein